MQPPCPIMGELACAASPMSRTRPLYHSSCLHPLDSRTVNLLIALDRSQIFLNRSPEFGKAFAQSLQSAPHFIVDVQVGHMPKAVCVPVSHRAEPKEAPVSEEEPQVSRAFWADRRKASPRHVPRIRRRVRAQGQSAHGRRYSVGANDKVILTSRAVAKLDRDAAIVLTQRRDGHAEPARHRGTAIEQHSLQFGPFDADTGSG